jgi:hypothetical protein
MPKVVFALLLVFSAAIYQRQWTLGLIDSSLRTFGYKLSSDLQINRYIPQWAQFGKR